MAHPTRSWIFQSNPEVFDLKGALRNLRTLSWVTRQHAKDIHPGDRVYMWESGPNAGIVGLCHVLTEPTETAPDSDSVSYTRASETLSKPEKRVRLQVDAVLEDRLGRDEIRANAALTGMSILTAPQSTNFALNHDEAVALEALVARTGNVEIARSGTISFLMLFREFMRQDVPAAEWQAHLAKYGALRQQARANLSEILAAQERGEDLTDLVLLKLLPHADTAATRQSGAWIHVAPAINNAIKPWFERARWTKSEDWPEVARLILEFVTRCDQQPEALAKACETFSKHPLSKGLQTGFLSPILNALRPERFVLINNKSRRVLNYFKESSYDQALQDYPATNAAALAFLEDHAAALQTEGVPATQLGDYFDMFCHWLVTEHAFDFDDTHGRAIWKISPGDGAWQWNECLEGGFIAIGWDELGDLSGISRQEFDRRSDDLLKKHKSWRRNGLNQVWRFAQIKPGDRIVANRGQSEVLGIGTVLGGYYFVPGGNQGHRLKVQWDDTTRRTVAARWRRTLQPLDQETFDAILASPSQPDETIVVLSSAATPVVQLAPAYPLAQLADETHLPLEQLATWLRAIQRKGQAILYGPPGTGKTYLAERLARHLVGGGDGFWELVQFHPAYTYEEFMQGLRPQPRPEGGLDYPLVPGRFLEFCERARQTQGPCVLLIDEINRANLSRVFGELMYLLEYRDREIPLAGGRRFSIPSNVYVIGTMNTADRSISLVDHALRRRFAFLALYPEYEVLRQYHRQKGFEPGGLIKVLQELNKQINDRHYEIGVSFFLSSSLRDHLPDIWQMEIEPYLEEYFFDRPDRVEPFRWSKLETRIMPWQTSISPNTSP